MKTPHPNRHIKKIIMTTELEKAETLVRQKLNICRHFLHFLFPPEKEVTGFDYLRVLVKEKLNHTAENTDDGTYFSFTVGYENICVKLYGKEESKFICFDLTTNRPASDDDAKEFIRLIEA